MFTDIIGSKSSSKMIIIIDESFDKINFVATTPTHK